MGKIARVFLIAVLIFLVALGGLLYIQFKDEIATMNSVKELVGKEQGLPFPVYYIDVKGNFYMEAFEEQGGVKSTQEMISFLTSQISRGFMKPEGKDLEPGACSRIQLNFLKFACA